MSSIKTALTSVKNFFTRIVNQEQQEDNPNEEGYLIQSSRFGRSLFGSGVSRKRPATTIYEPEITDDEDDTPGFPYFQSSHIPGAKRIRIESELELEMASRQGGQQSRYTTRGSGVPPTIEGSSSGLKASDRINTWDLSDRDILYSAPSTSRAASGNPNNEVKGLNINRPPGSKKNIEVITLEDDDPITSASNDFHGQQSTVTSPGRNQLTIMKPRISNPMKASRRRDSNRLTKCITDIGRSFLAHTSIRLKEKCQYKELLKKHNIINSSGMYQNTALTKSKVCNKELEVMYSKFDRSPTKGAVEFRFNGKRLSYESQNFTSSTNSQALVGIPRLFSTQQEVVPYFRPPPSFTETRAIVYTTDPEIVDLEKEPEPSSSNAIARCISPITPVTTRRSYTSTSPVGNYSNLEDALNNSTVPDETFERDSKTETSVLALPSSQEEEDKDITIIAEKVVNTSRNKSVNTLALEHTSCPFVHERWLNDSISTWRDNQKQRNKRIQEEAATLSILKRESDLDKDLEERIRKKLTLTEIIVLEEQPEELPELTDEILSLIKHAKQRGNESEVLAQVRLLKDTISITRGDVRTLGPSQWLNDNVINTYMGLIVLRSKQDKYPSVYAFQTFFYPKLMKEGYSNMLKRWTRKDDIFAHDLIILPIHLGLHWCLACVDLRKKTIRYYDSLGSDNNKCLHLLLDYITREMKERKGMDLDVNEWILENVKGIPQQQNGSDCGMFSCKFAEYISRDANFTFKQEDMPYYRDRMIYELIRSDLLHP